MSDRQQHTPGPWKANVRSMGASIKGPDGESIAWCGCVWMYCKGEVPFEANAKLIAAAPQLLASLQEMYYFARVRTGVEYETAGKLLRELEGKL